MKVINTSEENSHFITSDKSDVDLVLYKHGYNLPVYRGIDSCGATGSGNFDVLSSKGAWSKGISETKGDCALLHLFSRSFHLFNGYEPDIAASLDTRLSHHLEWIGSLWTAGSLD